MQPSWFHHRNLSRKNWASHILFVILELQISLFTINLILVINEKSEYSILNNTLLKLSIVQRKRNHLRKVHFGKSRVIWIELKLYFHRIRPRNAIYSLERRFDQPSKSAFTRRIIISIIDTAKMRLYQTLRRAPIPINIIAIVTSQVKQISVSAYLCTLYARQGKVWFTDTRIIEQYEISWEIATHTLFNAFY